MQKSSIMDRQIKSTLDQFYGLPKLTSFFASSLLLIAPLIIASCLVSSVQAGGFSASDTTLNTAKQVREITASEVNQISAQYLHHSKKTGLGKYYYMKYWADQTEAKYLSTEQRKQFIVWLNSDKGFDDKRLKRCSPGTHVGFQLSYSKSSKRTPRRVILDLKCLSITVLDISNNIDQGTRSYFDPSQATLLEILNGLFPKSKMTK